MTMRIVIGFVVKVDFVQVCIQCISATIFKGRVGPLTFHLPSSSDWLEVIRNLLLFYFMAFSMQHNDGLDKAIDVSSLRCKLCHQSMGPSEEVCSLKVSC